jgi:hypothetical protein
MLPLKKNSKPAAPSRARPAKSPCATTARASLSNPNPTIRRSPRADRECEQFIARELERAFPDDGLLGEEGAQKPSRSGRRWIIDPIDGTRDFVRGNPAWANLIGLEVEGEVVAGFACMPALGDLFAASRGGGAFVNGERIHASRHRQHCQAVLCFDSLNSARASRLPDNCSPGCGPSGPCAAWADAWTP